MACMAGHIYTPHFVYKKMAIFWFTVWSILVGLSVPVINEVLLLDYRPWQLLQSLGWVNATNVYLIWVGVFILLFRSGRLFLQLKAKQHTKSNWDSLGDIQDCWQHICICFDMGESWMSWADTLRDSGSKARSNNWFAYVLAIPLHLVNFDQNWIMCLVMQPKTVCASI